MLHTIFRAFQISPTQVQQLRLGHTIRGKAPTKSRTIRERIDELNYKDEIYTTRIDIGFAAERKSNSRQEQIDHIKKMKNDKQLEQLARNHQLVIDLEESKKVWLETLGPHHKKQIADHYGVFEHLYGEGFFTPHLNLEIFYDVKDLCIPVYTGNVIKPSEAIQPPVVSYKSDADSLWTLVLTSLDGHLTEHNKEYVHWLVANIPGGDVDKGDVMIDYLQPFPLKGTGYHRYAFVLYKQDNKISYELPKVLTSSLEGRTFVTRDWYKTHQEVITPAGLAFFQTSWDLSVRDFFHNILQEKEPIYEYDFPEPYIRKQEWFPLRRPFNLYMDKYRDPKEVKKEYLLWKLKNEDPFKSPEPPLKFPNAQPLPKSMPSWLKLHEKKLRLQWGRVNDV
ncbi:unnamed protein product [Leptosia nina]|uniref:Large ribosomal subunit protein mL38 n=1 Tax=Leptosia nina TaxID=320188 RepID=A0AAV1IX42_9NEOP